MGKYERLILGIASGLNAEEDNMFGDLTAFKEADFSEEAKNKSVFDVIEEAVLERFNIPYETFRTFDGDTTAADKVPATPNVGSPYAGQRVDDASPKTNGEAAGMPEW